MISKRHFVNKLKELKYVFKEQLHYQERFRVKGGTHILHVPRSKMLDENYIRSALKQAGQSKTQIDEFIKDAKA